MIKRIFLSILCLTIIFFAYGQKANYQYDSAIRKIIQRNIVQPDFDTCCPTGIAVIEISRKDSVTIRSLFASDSSYDLRPDKRYGKNLVGVFNKYYTNTFKKPYKVIVPLYYYMNDSEPSDELVRLVEEKVKKWKEKAHVMEPVIITSIYNQRKSSVGGK